jgi:hypothetical protein
MGWRSVHKLIPLWDARWCEGLGTHLGRPFNIKLGHCTSCSVCDNKLFECWQKRWYEPTCRNPTLAKCEDETHTPKVGDLESSGSPECLGFDSRGQNTSDWGVLSFIGKVLKNRCPKWPRIGHLDIWSPSYEQKKGRESNWQFDSWPLKVGNRPLPNVCRWSVIRRWKALEESYNFGSDPTLIGGWSRELWMSKVLGVQPGTVSGLQLGSLGKKSHSDVAPTE